jgi:hypothetical protein
MLKRMTCSRSWALAGAAALAAGLAAPVAADPVYSWRTADGGYAFTDDPKAIPARYRDQVEVREAKRLDEYKRYTPADDEASERYAIQLDRRLEHLRRVNAQPVVRAPQTFAGTPADPSGVSASVSMRSEMGFQPGVEIADATNGDEPIVVETLFTRPEGKMVTRQTTVVRQGDKTISIVKPRLREWNVADDIHDEAEFER